jgi:beta-glucuronidase
MLNVSLLYPRSTSTRQVSSLDGMWDFRFDPQSEGTAAGWANGLPDPLRVPVPASFADLFTDKASRDYCGDFWYATRFFVPAAWQNDRIVVRFGSVTHRCTVYCNGQEVARHEGGFLPVVADLTAVIRPGQENTLVVAANNELNETSIPCGATKVCADGSKLAKPYFDFFNYAGIQRSVQLCCLPQETVEDYTVSYTLHGADAAVHYTVRTNGSHPVRVSLYDADGNRVASAEGCEGVLQVPDAHLWQVRNAYLYRIVLEIRDGDMVLDSYVDRIGIRTIAIEGTRILVNGKPVYLKGYGKHEDFEVIGRGFSAAVMKRDFECMKWSNANCFRTSHYPYADEWYQFADEEGFLIIDEVPAVGMMRSTRNFVAAGQGQYTYFFEAPTVPQLQAAHIQATEEMIVRDRNHPSVFAWSLFNEPETTTDYAHDYFAAVFDAARALDPQHRPLTGAFEKNSKPELCKCYPLCDFICLNRYYGWYIKGGEMEEAEADFRNEMDRWAAKNLNVPFVFTEFGTDTLPTEHKLPSIMWSQEYQDEYLEMCFRVFDSYDFVQGELVWNFADFQTTEGIMRVNGNKKGIFTRARQPKDAAFVLKKRWETL